MSSWGGVIGCKQEDDEGGAIIEGTKLVGWDNPKGVIRIPDGVTVIGNSALSEQTEITGVIIPSSVLTIKEDAFDKCTSLGSVTFEGNGLRTIEKYAFCHCISLTSIQLPDSIVSIEVRAFSNCSNLTSAVVPGDNWIFSNEAVRNDIGIITTDKLMMYEGWWGSFTRTIE